jgi:hypothetical protein
VVVQRTTLIIRIIAIMLVLSTVVMEAMMVHMSDPAGLGEVGGNILLVLEGVLDVGADQRRNAGRLSQKQEPEEQRTQTR